MVTKEETLKMIEVMQAYADGKVVEYWSSEHKDWRTNYAFDKGPSWSWNTDKYRVQPDKPREFWLLYPNPPCMFSSKESAEAFRDKFRCMDGAKAIHVREVLE